MDERPRGADQGISDLNEDDPGRFCLPSGGDRSLCVGLRERDAAASYDILIRIANILGVSTDSLLGRRGMGSVTLDVSRLTQEQRGILQRTADLFADYNRLSGGGVSGEKEEQKGS